MGDIFTDQNFEEKVLQSKLPVLVDFFAVWCSPCQMLSPIIEEIAKEKAGKIKVGKLNVDEAPQTATKYNVMSVPTLILFRNGEVVKTLMGFRSKEDILKEMAIT